VDEWGKRLQLARQWVAEVNKRGGNARLIYLPEIGYKGNTYFPVSDLNNIQMADLMAEWLKKMKATSVAFVFLYSIISTLLL
jgi:hypothetical protein